MRKKLNKRKIEKDWLQAFPQFVKNGSINFLKRHECFLIGIYLYPISSHTCYEVCFYTYNLMDDIDIPVIPLISATYLKNKKGAINYFSMQQHEANLADIIVELKQQVPLLQKDELSVNDLIAYLKGVVGELDKEKTLTDIVLLNFWADNIEQAEQEIKNGRKIILGWEERIQNNIGGPDAWEKHVRNLMSIETLNKTVEVQIEKYKLENLKNYELIKR